MKRVSLPLAVLLSACGPAVVVDEGGTEGQTGSSGDGTDTLGTGSEGAQTVTTWPVTATDPTTGTTDTTPFPTTEGESSSFGGTDLPPVQTECWLVEPMFEAPGDARKFVADQNGDGVDEIWIADNDGNGPGGTTTVFAVDATGSVLGEQTLDGFVIRMGDLDDDGLLDIILVAFGPGGPSFAYLRSDGAFEFEIAPLSFDVDINPRVSGFFDVTLDGRLDAFELQTSGQLDLLIGDGDGGLSPSASLMLRPLEGMLVAPVEEAPSEVVVQSAGGFGGGGGGCVPTEYHVVGTANGVLEFLGQTEDGAYPDLGPLHRARLSPSGVTEIFADACDPKAEPGQGLHDVRVLTQSDDFTTLDSELVVGGKLWATVFDHDGDGILDAVYGDDPEVPIAVLWRDGGGGYTPLDIGIPGGDVRDNDVRGGDLDGNGREELIRGTAIDGSETARLYERVFLGPCR